MKLTEEQKHIIKEVLKFDRQEVKIGGFAGSGKTVLVQHLQQLLPTFSVCAYTGKAANVLRKKGITEASTIHSLIYKPELDASGKMILDSNGNPTFALSFDLGCEGIIIDEASMVSEEIYKDLRSFNIPLVFVGDHGQLPPISGQMNVMESPDYRLETIHRNAGEIAHFADYIRKGYRPASFQSSGKVQFIEKYYADQYLTQVDQIICAYNKTRVTINQKVRGQKGLNPDFPEKGDRIMCLKNDKKQVLFNGMQGTLQKLFTKPKNKMIFVSDEDATHEIFFDPAQFNRDKYDFSTDRDAPHPFDYAYCITGHKSQGDEFERVMVFEQRCDLWDHRRWSYVCASRAKKQIFWVEP